MRRALIIAGLILLCAIALAACGGPSVEQATEGASEFCVGHGGVSALRYSPDADWLDPAYYSAECADGSEIE